MASSQVEFATSSSPFGCATVHNRFQKNLSHLVVNSRIPNANSHHHIDYTDLWVHQPQWQGTTPAHNDKKYDNNNNNNGPIEDEDGGKNVAESAYSIASDTKIDETRHRHQKDKWARAREMVFGVDHGVAPPSSSPKDGGSNSSTPSESSVETPNLGGVSSLVQKWRGFEAVAKCSTKSCNSGTPTATTTTTATTAVDNVPNEDDALGIGDWESVRTAVSGPPSSRGRVSDATENERLRVSDIIRKLSEDSPGCEYSTPPRVRISYENTEQQRSFSPVHQRCSSPVLSSPRLRGRQAFHDLLMQIERERHNELEGLVARRAVTKFPQRGRIQSLLRTRFLRRATEAKDSRHSNNAPSDQSHESIQSPTVHSRERVDSSVPNGSVQFRCSSKELTDHSTTPAVAKGKSNQCRELTYSKSFPGLNAESSITSTTNHEYDGHNSHKIDETQIHSSKHEGTPSSTFIWQETDSEFSKNSLVEFMETTNIDMYPTETTKSLSNEVGWDDLHFDHHQQPAAVNNTDWIYEVSRPHSDWEGLRKARYQEMLDPFTENEEIRALLGRKSVSNFLSSGLRKQIDRVMMSRAQEQQTIMHSQIDEEEQQERERERERVLEKKVRNVTVIEEEDWEHKQNEERESYGNYYDEFEEAESSIGQLSKDQSDDYVDQTTTTSSPQSWPLNIQGHEVSDNSYQMDASLSTQKSLSSSISYSQDSRATSSFPAHPATEMELIFDLRRHMEQLHGEISELRRSIKCCMSMQSKLQRSIKQEVHTALNRSDIRTGQDHVSQFCPSPKRKNSDIQQNADVKKGRRNSGSKPGNGGKCCICSKVEVDSLLYRCGHMCTCYNCAHELQWNSGKCPICGAPIMDVVRTYYNS